MADIYHVAMVRNYTLQGNCSSGLAGVTWINDSPLTLAEAAALVSEENDDVYYTCSGEYTRPYLYIVSDEVRDELDCRRDDPSCYDWDDYDGDDPDNDDETYLWRCQNDEAYVKEHEIAKGGSAWAMIDTRTTVPEDQSCELYSTQFGAEAAAYRAWNHLTNQERTHRAVEVAKVTIDDDWHIDLGVGYTPAATLAAHDDGMTWKEAGEYIRRNPRATLYAARYDGSVWSAGRMVDVGEVISCHLTRAAAFAACTDHELSSDFDREHLTTSVEEITAEDFCFDD